MKDRIACTTHGQAEATAVCPHLVDTLEDSRARGFNWTTDPDGVIQAFCDRCWNATDAEWAPLSAAGCRIICVSCLDQVAAINGVTRETV